jgi:hypothetical protein
VGNQVYDVWLDMLRRLVPEGRTHRLAPTIAAMLQFAAYAASEKGEPAEGTIGAVLHSADDAGYEEGEEMLLPIVQRLFKDAGVEYERQSARGERYSIAEEAAREYISWFNYSWDE